MPEETTAEQTTEQQTEETTQEEQAQEETTSATLMETAGQPLVDKDGKFAANWRDNLPEELRAEKALDGVTDLANLAKQWVDTKKMVGANKVALPGEKSSEEEWNAFYKAIGRPEKPDDYQVDIPDDFKDLYTDERMKATRDLFFQLGGTQQQFERFMKFDMEMANKLIEQQDALDRQAEAEARRSAEEKLRAEFGGAYDERIHVSNRLVTEAFPNEEQRMDFLQKYGNDPDFIRFASIVGGRLSESKATVAKLTRDTPQELDKRISELQNKPGYLGPYRNNEGQMVEMPDAERRELTQQIRELEKQKYPASV